MCFFTEHPEPEHQTAAEDVQRPAGEQTRTFKTFDLTWCVPHPHGLDVFQVKVTNILSAIDAAEYLMAHNASHVVKQVGDHVIIGIHACRHGGLDFRIRLKQRILLNVLICVVRRKPKATCRAWWDTSDSTHSGFKTP